MRTILVGLWNDDGGIVAFEYLLVATIIGLGLVVGLGAVSVALNAELTELAQAILALDQSYSYATQSTCVSIKNGSAAQDTNGCTTYHMTYGEGETCISGTVKATIAASVCP